jgi:hypothetical protein
MASALSEAYLEETQRELEIIYDLWMKLRQAIERAVSGEVISREEENEFLKIKSDGTKYHRILKGKLSDQKTKIKKLEFNYDRMVEIFRGTISIAHIRNLPDADQTKMRSDWHRIAIQLLFILGSYEFLQSGEVIIKKRQHRKSKGGKTGLPGLMGKVFK